MKTEVFTLPEGLLGTGHNFAAPPPKSPLPSSPGITEHLRLGGVCSGRSPNRTLLFYDAAATDHIASLTSLHTSPELERLLQEAQEVRHHHCLPWHILQL